MHGARLNAKVMTLRCFAELEAGDAAGGPGLELGKQWGPTSTARRASGAVPLAWRPGRGSESAGTNIGDLVSGGQQDTLRSLERQH